MLIVLARATDEQVAMHFRFSMRGARNRAILTGRDGARKKNVRHKDRSVVASVTRMSARHPTTARCWWWIARGSQPLEDRWRCCPRHTEKGNLSEVLCKPKIMPIKSVSLERLEAMEFLHAGLSS